MKPPSRLVTARGLAREIQEFLHWREGGCCLHAVVIDENLHDGDLDWAINNALWLGHPGCAELAVRLQRATRTQRSKAIRLSKREVN